MGCVCEPSRHLAPQVNGTLGWWRIKSLPGEICLARHPVETGSVHRGNTVDIRQKSAEAIVAGIKQTGGRDARLNNETHGTNHPAKG